MAYIKGKWKWNENFSDVQGMGAVETRDYTVAFTSNGEEYKGIGLFTSATNGTPTGIYYNLVSYHTYYKHRVEVRSLEVHEVNSNGYIDWYTSATFTEAYRIMDFGEVEQYIDDAIYDFIVANAERILTTISEKFEVIAENEQKVYNAGKKAGEDAFWDIVQKSGRRTAYDTAFCWWDSEYLHPKYKVVPTYSGGAKNMIYRCDNLKKVEAAYFDLSQLPNPMSASGGLAYLFGLCNALEEIEDVGIQPCYSLEAFCYSDPKLKKVAIVRVADSTIVKNMLYYCRELEDVTIEGTIGQSGINLQYSTKLSKASIISFINALSDTATGQSITFSKAAVDREFRGVSPADFTTIVDGSHSLEWYNIVEIQKTNWTITLV